MRPVDDPPHFQNFAWLEAVGGGRWKEKPVTLAMTEPAYWDNPRFRFDPQTRLSEATKIALAKQATEILGGDVRSLERARPKPSVSAAPSPPPPPAPPAQAALPPPPPPRPPYDRMAGLTSAQIHELQAWEVKHGLAKSKERLALEDEAKELGLEEEDIERLSDHELKKYIRNHKLSDGHGHDAVPYPLPLKPEKDEGMKQATAAIKRRIAVELGGVDTRLAPQVSASVPSVDVPALVLRAEESPRARPRRRPNVTAAEIEHEYDRVPQVKLGPWQSDPPR